MNDECAKKKIKNFCPNEISLFIGQIILNWSNASRTLADLLTWYQRIRGKPVQGGAFN